MPRAATARTSHPTPEPTPAPVVLPQGSTQRSGVTLAFGPIHLTVSVVTSVGDDKEASLRLICTGDHEGAGSDLGSTGGGFVPMNRVTACPVCETDEHLGRAMSVADGLVPIPAPVLEAAEAADKAFADELQFVAHPVAEIETLTRPTGSRYYVTTKANAPSNNYALIRELVRRRPQYAFVTRFALKGKAVPYRLNLEGETLVLEQLVSDPQFVKARPHVDGTVVEAFLDLTLSLADQTVKPFDPADYVRPRLEVLRNYVEGKVPTPFSAGVAATGDVSDLFAQLQAAVKAHGGTVEEPKPARKPRARKAS